MGTRYRVDRSQGECPCGMNSIVCLTDSLREAERAFDWTTPGRDAWNQVDSSHGVLLSRWDGRDYVRVNFKTLPN